MSRPRRIRVRDLRKNLRAFLRGGGVVSIGDEFTLRAILVPIEEHQHWSTAARRRAIAKAQRQFNEHANAEAADD